MENESTYSDLDGPASSDVDVYDNEFRVPLTPNTVSPMATPRIPRQNIQMTSSTPRPVIEISSSDSSSSAAPLHINRQPKRRASTDASSLGQW